jgi:hypothetical protein
MDYTQAHAIVRSLANGIDPDTGAIFPPDSPIQRPQTVRALYQACETLERAMKFARRQDNLPERVGESWPEDEDRMLLAAFDRGCGLQELASAHKRTISGVRARLVKYGRIAA